MKCAVNLAKNLVVKLSVNFNLVINLIATFIFTILIAACSGSEPASSGISGPGGGSGSSGGGQPTGSNSPLEIRVRTNYIGNTSSKSVLVECITPAGTLTTSPAANGVCTVQMPELDMYFSDFEFRVATNSPETCTRVVFIPFEYQRSTSDVFPNDSVPNGTFDCSGGRPAEPNCYGGAARFINEIEGYPANQGSYFLTVNSLSQVYTMDAPDINRSKDAHRSGRTNINIANNFTGNRAANINAAGVVDYVANTFEDYQFICQNSFGEVMYSWTLIMGDDDLLNTGSNTTFDSIYDWGN